MIQSRCLHVFLILFLLFAVACENTGQEEGSDGDKDSDRKDETADPDFEMDGDGDPDEMEHVIDSDVEDEIGDVDPETDGGETDTGDETDTDGDADEEESDRESQFDGDVDDDEYESESVEDIKEIDQEYELYEETDLLDSLDSADVEEDGNGENDGEDIEAYECEGEVEICFEGACGSFGSCQVGDGEINCICETGYTGDRCEDCDRKAAYRWNEGKTECLHMPCPEYPCDEDNHQDCHTSTGECRCVDNTHWSSDGITCTDDVCDPNRCLDVEHSNGICIEEKKASKDFPGNRICECEDGFNYDYGDDECVLDCDDRCYDPGDLYCNWGDLLYCQPKNDYCSQWVVQEVCESGYCFDDQSCAVCEHECDAISRVCDGDTLKVCERDEYGCRKFSTEECDLACEDGECLTVFCGSGEIEEYEYCDSSTVSCSSICSDYVQGEAACNDGCTAYNTLTCEQPNVTAAFNRISAGVYEMGTIIPWEYEPRHTVTLTNDFKMQNLQVTQADYQGLMGYNPSVFTECGPTCPVENLSYFDAIHYANKLSEFEGLTPCIAFSDVECADGAAVADESECLAKGGIHNAVISLNGSDTVYSCEGYRLPTDAEWEYAARAGYEGDFFYNGIAMYHDELNGADPCPALMQISWYLVNSAVDYDGDDYCAGYLDSPGSKCGTHPVGMKQPNGNCLYDITGNTYEWVFDKHSELDEDPVTDPVSAPTGIAFSDDGSTEVGVRGCSWRSTGGYCRLFNRFSAVPMTMYHAVGFRLVRTLGAGTK